MRKQWSGPYQTIISAKKSADELIVEFANRDIVAVPCNKLVPLGFSGISWSDIHHDPDGLFICIPARPGDLELYWDTIRNLTDEEFAKDMAQAAAKQARYIGRRLKQLRERRELTQAKLASIAGIEQANLSRIENGVFDVSASTLWKLLGAMGFSARDLVP